MKKKKLLTAKEARSRVDELENSLNLCKLAINSLQNDLKSMEGARDNCKHMHEWSSKQLDEKKGDIDLLKKTIKDQQFERTFLNNKVAATTALLNGYTRETPSQLVGRAIGMVATSIKTRVMDLVISLGFKSAK